MAVLLKYSNLIKPDVIKSFFYIQTKWAKVLRLGLIRSDGSIWSKETILTWLIKPLWSSPKKAHRNSFRGSAFVGFKTIRSESKYACCQSLMFIAKHLTRHHIN